MRSPKPVVLAMFLSMALLWSLLPPVLAQGGGIAVNADYELFGTTVLNGGGHVTWTLTGDAARQLRADIVHLFDGYSRIPRGFTFGGDPTYGNHDGIIDEPEGLAYTDRLENVLEGLLPNSPSGGTQVGYFLLDRATLLEKDLAGGFNRSTAGIVGTDANTTGSLQIQFLFNGATNTADVTMPLTTQAYVQALFRVFSIEADQAGSWPVQTAATSAPGWHLRFYDATHLALWAGNVSSCSFGNQTSCRYDNGTSLGAETFMDSSLGASGAPLDLRFATSASVTFNYTGRVADPGDYVQVQVAPEAANLSWTTLPGGTLSVLQNTSAGQWAPMSLNLSAYLGQEVRLRLLFTSDSQGTACGFFLQGFAIHAPSIYFGPIVESDAHYLIGTLSFSNFHVPSGGATLIRTPGGEILFYSDSFATDAPSPDTVRFEAFDVLENPQALFVVMITGAYFVSRLQERAYDDYREAHSSVYRPAVRKARWLHWLGRIVIALLLLFYFVPTALFFLGIRLYFNGPAYYVFAVTAVLGLGFGTRTYYNGRLEAAPPPGAPDSEAIVATVSTAAEEPVAEAEPEVPIVGHCTHCLQPIYEDERTYDCSCGALYHLNCASSLMRCSDCRKPIASLGRLGEKRAVTMRCAACGEIQTVPEDADPRALRCTSCGGSLRNLDAGKRYLLVASNPGLAFHWLADLTKGGKSALVLTPAAPERLRLEYGLKGVQFLQVSNQGGGAIDPRKLDPAGLKALLPLTRSGKGGVILYDGLDQMITASSMSDIIRFLSKANDMAFVHQITVLARVAPGLLGDSEIRRLSSEFDEVLDLSARL
jgi:ribosomal protein S27E